MPYKKRKIAVALSGGIDSAMAAYILKDKGDDIFGLHIKVLPESDDSGDAEMVADSLGIDLKIIDLSIDFDKNIIIPFCNSYLEGKTPNPCVECNKYIKFGKLLDEAFKSGASFIATGHYCIVQEEKKSQRYILKKGIDESKDQSYFLWRLQQQQLRSVLMPLGTCFKKDIKHQALRYFPFLKDRSDSQEVCFIKGDYRDFLKEKLGTKKIRRGPILDTRGALLGWHEGIPFYTIGQRRGLGVSHSEPLYVKEIDPIKNTVILGTSDEILKRSLRVTDLSFIAGKPPGDVFDAEAMIRYNSKGTPATVKIGDEGSATIELKKPQRSVTPGQSAVLYDNDVLIGGGIIKR